MHHKICLSASAYHPELWQPSWSSEYSHLLVVRCSQSMVLKAELALIAQTMAAVLPTTLINV